MSDNNNTVAAMPVVMPVVWSVAGSDNSGGAGIQADNFTFHDFGVHGCNIITAITAQNSSTVVAVVCVAERMFELQWETLQEEYVPAAIKLGMLGNGTVVNALVKKLATSTAIVVCDPVLSSTTGKKLIESSQYYQQVLPLVDVLTPNQQEFATLFDVQFTTPQELEQHALRIAAQHKLQLMITGGDSVFGTDNASDLCVLDGQLFWLHSPKVATNNTHGTGCTLSSAIASALALGYSLPEACVLAKAYINQGMHSNAVLSSLKGPLQHNGFPSRLENLPLISSSFSPAAVQFPVMDTRRLGIYPVVDSLEWLERCLWESIKTIQLRVKNIEGEALEKIIADAVAMGKKFKARVFINDYWQLAIKHNAYGVHLGQEDLDTADLQAIANAGLYLGISTHSWYEIARAHSLCPSYIAIGPIFATTTKVMAFAPQGLAQLQQWVNLIGDAYPLVAIGGIDTANARAVLDTGVGSVAMVRAITEAPDYRQAIRELSALVNS